MRITITCYGVDDYDVYFEDTDCSVRGTLEDILNEIREYLLAKKEEVKA